MDQRVRAVITLMKANLNRPLPVSEMAQSVNLSESHLRHLFRKETGQPIAHFLRELRLERGKELLESTFLSIKQIRVRVGFQSTNRFLANFKKMHGITCF